MNIVNITNKIFRSKGNLLKIEFMVEGRSLYAFVPDDQLFVALKDILLNREYEYLPEFELNKFKGKIVVDAGAHVGLYSLLASVFAKKVVAIEPHPVNFRILEANIVMNDIQNIVTINKALWHEETILDLYEGENTAGHSLLLKEKESFSVNTITLKDIIEKFGKIDLLKVDIEGSEFKVLERLEGSDYKNVKNIVTEVHSKYGDINHLINSLAKSGFNVKEFSCPLIEGSNSYHIKVNNLVGLKVFRKLVYSLSSLMQIKDKTLSIIFAR